MVIDHARNLLEVYHQVPVGQNEDCDEIKIVVANS